MSLSARPNTPGVSDKPPSAKTKGGKGGKGGGKKSVTGSQQQVDGKVMGWLVACMHRRRKLTNFGGGGGGVQPLSPIGSAAYGMWRIVCIAYEMNKSTWHAIAT